jgi:hypothetical protein
LIAAVGAALSDRSGDNAMTMMSCKAYEAVIEYDEVNLRVVITFQGKSLSEPKRAFAASAEDYLAFCRQRGEEPDQTGLVPHRVTGHSISQ